MPSDFKENVPQDLGRINVGDPLELAYFSKKFNESPEKLRQLVAQHGVTVHEIERALGKKGSLL